MTDKMMALLTAYFLYHGDATWGWWFVWGLVLCLYGVQEIKKAKAKMAQEIEAELKYWEGK